MVKRKKNKAKKRITSKKKSTKKPVKKSTKKLVRHKKKSSRKVIKKVVKKPIKKKIKRTTKKLPKGITSIDNKKKLCFVKLDDKGQVINRESITNEKEIALDFSARAYERFSRLIKSIVLFGSTAKNTTKISSDIDLMIIVDDASVLWDQELVAWYREELGKIISSNKYSKDLHINTTKLTNWWNDILNGDPVAINVLRYGEAVLDFGGFFNPLKILLQQGKIRSSPEAIFTSLQRAPEHLARSKAAELSAIEGVYWAMTDSAHSALMAAKKLPPSPEQIAYFLEKIFVKRKLLKSKYVDWYKNLYELHKKIIHRSIKDLRGDIIDEWQDRADEFIGIMAELVKKLTHIEDRAEKKDM